MLFVIAEKISNNRQKKLHICYHLWATDRQACIQTCTIIVL